MCIWRVNKEDRLCGYCIYRQCSERPTPIDKAHEVCGEYASILSRLMGVDVLEDSRKQAVVWGRNMIAYQMCLDGFTQELIASCIGRDRCTVVHCVKSIETMMSSPYQYWKENEIWNKFREKLSLKKNT